MTGRGARRKEESSVTVVLGRGGIGKSRLENTGKGGGCMHACACGLCVLRVCMCLGAKFVR